MRKMYLCMLIVLSILFITTACSLSKLSNSKKDIACTLDVDLSSATVLQSMDSHGGFHGDGNTYVRMTFADDGGKTFVKELENNGV